MSVIQKIKNLHRRHRRDERGATLIFTALSMILLIWAGATGVNLGFSVAGGRQAQSIADTVALDLARYISYADTLSPLSAVQNYLNAKRDTVLSDNGYTTSNPSAQLTVTPGYYSNGTFTKNGPSGTCQSTKVPVVRPGCNAVEVTAQQSVPQIFLGGTRLVSAHSGNTTTGSISRSSIATDSPQANFSIGSFLASLNTNQLALLNKILSSVNTTGSLTLVGYQGLVVSNITLAQLIQASGGVLSPTNVMTAQLTAAQWLNFWTIAVGNQYGLSSAAYTGLKGLGFTNSSSTLIPLCQMLNINMNGTLYSCTNSPLPTQGLNTGVNVMQMITTEAELANNNSGIDVGAALNLASAVPGLHFANVTLTLDVIQPIQVAYGPVNTSVSTQQVKSTLSMDLSLPILGTPLGTLSFQLGAAGGTAILQTLTCVDNQLFAATIAGSTTALSTNVNLNLLGVQSMLGTLTVNGAGPPPISVGFTGPENPLGSNVPPTASTLSAGTNPVTISASTGLTFQPNGVINSLISSLMGVLTTSLAPELQALGVQLAGAQIADLGTNCGAVSLVQ